MGKVRGNKPSSPWTKREEVFLRTLHSPIRVQAFLDSIPYSIDPFTRSAREVLRDRRANCFDGALFAAAALQRLGFPPLLVDLSAVEDDDHVLAIFHRRGRIGAVAKSNYASLRYREPIFRSIRELVMSYFEGYFNLARKKTLRAYSVPIDLRQVADWDWIGDRKRLDDLSDRLTFARHYPLLTASMIRRLQQVDERTFRAETLGLDIRGAYKV